MNTDSLTAQQHTVFALLIQGKSNAEIGQALHLAEKTIKTHVTDIFKKLECTSRAQLIARHYMEQQA
jgi:DNA-binding NarL/FixJ family response regulator